MFAVAAQGEYLNLLQTSLSALANLLCLGASHGPLPRLGICALELAAKTGKVQLKVRDIHTQVDFFSFLAFSPRSPKKKFYLFVPSLFNTCR
jgi:hypothetical protein